MQGLKQLYEKRFQKLERVRKEKLWQILCQDFLQQFVGKEDLVVDLGAGHCEFINNIKCRKRIAVDANKDVKIFASKGVKVYVSSIKHLKKLFRNNSLDVVFMSNLLEHLESKEDVFRLLNETYHVLKVGGKLLIMQPDIKLVGGAYWDFFDHKVPLTCQSLLEVLKVIGFKLVYLRYPFLPYTTKVRFLPLWPTLLKIYLKIRFLHFIFGKQFFVCAQK